MPAWLFHTPRPGVWAAVWALLGGAFRRYARPVVTLERVCNRPGCPRYATGNGYCLQHQSFSDKHTASRSVRGYDQAWYRFRAWFLRGEPLCRDCKALGIFKPAIDLHHIRPLASSPELRLDASNVVPLCKRCHTRRERTGRNPGAKMPGECREV